MLSFLNKYAKDYVFSQNGEEGIILECVRRLEGVFLLNKGHAVEIGGNDGRFCSNIALLLQQRGWSGLFVEADYSLHLQSKKNWDKFGLQVKHQCAGVDEKNIHAFVKADCDLLSLDTDGSDYRLFHALKVKPKIVVIEIDSSFLPDQLGFNSDGAAGYGEMLRLAQLRGYFLLCHTGNMVFVDEKYKDLFPEIDKDPFLDSGLYFKRDWVKKEAA